MDSRSHPVARLIACYARHTGRTVGTVSLYASGSGATYARLAAGADITTRRATRIVQWLSDHWPESAEWPTDIPRPAPSPDGNPNPPAGGQGSASLSSAPASTSRAGVPARGGPSTAAPGRAGDGATEPAGPAASLKEAASPSRWPVPHGTSADPAASLSAWPLDARGHVRDEAALADTLRVARATVYTVISRYADDGPRATRWPRGQRSDSHRTLRALLATGDTRFRRRRAQWVAMAGALGAAA